MALASAKKGQQVLLRDKDGSKLNTGNIVLVKKQTVEIEWALPFGGEVKYTPPFKYYKGSKTAKRMELI